MQFVTVDKNSPEYRGYLRGDFSRSQRAIPVPRLEILGQAAHATFQIIEGSQLPPKSGWRRLVELYRPSLTAFTVFPVVTLCLWLEGSLHLDLWLMLAALLFHGAVFAFNDYFDHMQGVDRMSEKRGSRLIQNGYLRAVDVLKIAWVYWALAVAAGLPVILERPGVLLFLVAGLALATLGSTYSRLSFKAFALNDVTLFFCLGPLLTGSVAYAKLGHIPTAALILGAAMGLMAVIYVQARHLSTAMTDYRAGVQTTVVRLGFDRTKLLLVMELCLIFGLYGVMVGRIGWGLPAIGVVLLWSLKDIMEVRSPVSSRAEQLAGRIARHQLYILAVLMLVLQ